MLHACMYLVCPANEVKVVFVEELGDSVAPKGERDASVVLPPPGDVLVGIGPQEVAQETRVWHVRWSGYGLDLFKIAQIG